jgi:multidrug resistance efflux pump
LKQFNKLTVTAPIRGTISDVLVDVGQELSVGTPVFGIVSTDNQLVEISVTADELGLLGL